MTENESLKRLVSALEHSGQQSDDLESENQQLKFQLEDIRNLNASLATGDAETVYKDKYEIL
jgi:cell shape-determining protein MreC